MRSNTERMAACRTVLGILCLAAVVILNTEAAIETLDAKSVRTSTPNATTPSVNTRTTISALKSPTTNKPQQPAEARQNVAATGTSAEDLDGRSAYVNNQYIPEEPFADADNPPPLYQFLQQQMEQILASTGTEVSEYAGDSAESALQNGVAKPSHPYALGSFKHYHDEQENAASAKEQEKIFHAYTTKPGATEELPRPIAAAPTQHNVKPTKTSATAYPSKMQPSYGSQPTPISMPLQQLGTKNAYLTRNSTIHMRKRRITFKTVSSASQIIATPLANLMFKFSIGIAEPSISTPSSTKLVVGHDADEDTEPGYTGNLDLPQRNRPAIYTQKSVGISNIL